MKRLDEKIKDLERENDHLLRELNKITPKFLFTEKINNIVE